MPFEIGRTQIIIGVVVLALFILAMVPLMGGVGKSSAREEVPTNVEAIRMAEIQYHGAFESYVSAEAAPRDPLKVDSTPVAWKASPGFRTLSWAPASDRVVGSYWVNANATGFTVNGTCDVDDNGVQARFTATLDSETSAITEDSVY